MSELREWGSTAFAWVTGWAVCMFVLGTAYVVGHWATGHFGERISPDAAGLLSAVAVVWLYERRRFETELGRIGIARPPA